MPVLHCPTRLSVSAVPLCAALLWAWPASSHASWPTLELAVRQARARAPEVAAARGEVGVAEAAGVKARLPSVGNPFVQVFVDRSVRSPSAYVQPELYVPIAVPGQRSARIEEANRQLLWRRSEQDGMAGMALGQAVGAYGEATVHHARLQLARSAEHLAREEAALTAERAALQDVTAVDLNLARAEVARYAQQSAEAQLQFLEARGRLAMLTGLSDLGEPTQGPALPAPSRAIRRDWVMARVEQAPLLGALRAAEHYWSAARLRAESEKLQPITFIMWGARTEAGDVRAGGGVGWTLPLLDRNQGEVARVLAERQRVQLAADATRQALRARAEAAVGTWEALHAALDEVENRGIPAALAVVEATDESRRAGKVDRLRVILARRDLVAAQDRRLQLLQSAWTAYGMLAGVLGELP